MSWINRLRQIDFGRRARSTLLYFGATIISFVLSLATYPFFAEKMGVEEFAALNYFTNYSGFFGFLFSLNLYLYYSAIYFRNNAIQNEETLKSFMLLLLLWNILCFVVVYFLSVWLLESVLHVKFDVRPLLLSSLIAVSLVSLRSVFMIKLRLAKQALHFFIFSVLSRVGVISLSLLFVLYYEPTANGRLLGALAAEVLCTGLIYAYVFRSGGFSWPKMDLKETGRFVWPLLLASLVYYPVTAVDQVILEKFATTTELGLYSIGLGFAAYLHTFNFSIYQTLEPDLIKAHTQGNFTGLRNISVALVAITAATTIVFCFVSRYLIDFISNGKFTAAWPIANWHSISFLFVLLFSIGSTLLTTSHKSGMVLLVNAVGLVCIIVFAFALRHFDATGIAWARILTYMIVSVLSLGILRSFARKSTQSSLPR